MRNILRFVNDTALRKTNKMIVAFVSGESHDFLVFFFRRFLRPDHMHRIILLRIQ